MAFQYFCPGCRAAFWDETSFDTHTLGCDEHEAFWAEFDKWESRNRSFWTGQRKDAS